MPAELRLAVQLGAWCALRYGEVFELRRKDIDPVQGGGRIDLRTGEVWTQSAIGYLEDVGELDPDDDDDQRWLEVACEGSRDSCRDDDLLARWYGLSDDRHRGRARAWLAVEGYTRTTA